MQPDLLKGDGLATDPGIEEEAIDEILHPIGGAFDSFEVCNPFWGKCCGTFVANPVTEGLDEYERFLEVMGDDVGEVFEFRIPGPKMFCRGREGLFYIFPIGDVTSDLDDSSEFSSGFPEWSCRHDTWDMAAIGTGLYGLDLYSLCPITDLGEGAVLGVAQLACKDIVTFMSLYLLNPFSGELAVGAVDPNNREITVDDVHAVGGTVEDLDKFIVNGNERALNFELFRDLVVKCLIGGSQLCGAVVY